MKKEEKKEDKLQYLTARQHAWVMLLLRRTTMVRLSEKVGISYGVLSKYLTDNPAAKSKIRESVVAKLMALKLDDFEKTRVRYGPAKRVKKTKEQE